MPLTPGQTTNELMAWGFRAIIALATLIGLPVAGALLSRVISTIDGIAAESQTHTIQLNTVGTKLDFLTGISNDHEIRLRQLERRPDGR